MSEQQGSVAKYKLPLTRAQENWFVATRPVDGQMSVSWGAVGQPRDYRSLQSGWRLIVCGRVLHPNLDGEALWDWCISAISAADCTRLSQLLGSFVLVAEAPSGGGLWVVTDVLGSRPLMTCRAGDAVVLGTDALVLREQGLAGDTVNPEAIACWLMYGYNCSDSSLIEGLKLLPPASLIACDLQGFTAQSYLDAMSEDVVSQEELPDRQFELVAESMRCWLQEAGDVVLPLSGGFDSRLLAGLYCRQRNVGLVAHTFRFTEGEQQAAQQVADILGLELRIVDVGDPVWGYLESSGGAHVLSPDGLPLTKFALYVLACEHRGLPMLNGYMGDPLLRGTHDRINGKLEGDYTEPLELVIQRAMVATDLSLFHSDFAQRIRERAMVPVAAAVANAQGQQVFFQTDMWLRQQRYISNNFLEHLDCGEAMLPFMTPALVNLKRSNPDLSFNVETYQELFRRHLPELADLPHSSELPAAPRVRGPRRDRVLSRWAMQSLRAELARTAPGPFNQTRYLPRLAGAVFSTRWDYVALLGRRTWLLEQAIEAVGLKLDWQAI